MQKDFHHAVTYTVARLAGFDHHSANVIGSSAQYVDDAIGEGVIDFTNGTQYRYIASAHKHLDRRNFRDQENRKIWIPFHFLPGNNGKRPRGKLAKGKDYRKKLITRRNSHVAQDMLRESIRSKNEPWGLHLFGIVMHVYADTWAHQDFIGKVDKYNNVKIVDKDHKLDRAFLKKLKQFFKENFDELLGRFVSGLLPLGHAAALACPDLPYLKWTYIRKGEVVFRDNPKEYTLAVKHMYRAMCRFLTGDPEMKVADLSKETLKKFKYLFSKIKHPSPEVRHEEWVKLLRNDEFGFGSLELDYHEHGKQSWVFKATGHKSEDRLNDAPVELTTGFFSSDWKLFHDALLVHRFNIINRILPTYGIVEPYS